MKEDRANKSHKCFCHYITWINYKQYFKTYIYSDAQSVPRDCLRLQNAVFHSFAQGFHIGGSIEQFLTGKVGGLLKEGQVWTQSSAVGDKPATFRIDLLKIQGGHFLTAPLQTLIFQKVFNEICWIFSMIFFRDPIF